MRLMYQLAQLFNEVEEQINIPKADAGADKVQTVLQIVFQVTGVIAVLIIAIAGLSYVLSGGDPQRTARAKDAILYAIIGLVVSIMAFVIVTFVIGRLF
jgi:hypothetical protein